jgi:glycosyltransferase involved in cell wall biosynthesis
MASDSTCESPARFAARPTGRTRSGPRDAAVGYVLTGWPRRSELFIASEIHRMEQLGVRLRLYVLTPHDEPDHHPVVDRIRAQPRHLPGTAKLGRQGLVRWLRENAGPFLPALRRTARRHPLGLLRAAAAAGAQAVRARDGRRPRTIYVKDLLLAVGLADEIHRDGDVRHLHAHFAHRTTTVTWLAAMISSLPFSFTGHAKDIYRGSLNPAGLLARKMCAATFVATCTGANEQHLRDVAPAAPVHLVYHGLNADFAALLAEPAAPVARPERFTVIGVGRLVPKKGFDVLVDAVADLRERGLDVDLVIAGEDGDDADRVRARIAEHGLTGHVEMAGPLTQAELLHRYRSSTVFALACRVVADGDRDGIPNVLVEAMAAGLPVVSTTVSGIPELVRDGENGLLVAPDDPAALAEALLGLAKDPAERDRLAAAGAATVAARFDGDRLARRMADLLDGAVR